MAEAHELPEWLGKVHPRYHVPRHAVLAIGLFVFAIVLVFDLREVLPVASFYLLVWFAITPHIPVLSPACKLPLPRSRLASSEMGPRQ